MPVVRRTDHHVAAAPDSASSAEFSSTIISNSPSSPQRRARSPLFFSFLPAIMKSTPAAASSAPWRGPPSGTGCRRPACSRATRASTRRRPREKSGSSSPSAQAARFDRLPSQGLPCLAMLSRARATPSGTCSPFLDDVAPRLADQVGGVDAQRAGGATGAASGAEPGSSPAGRGAPFRGLQTPAAGPLEIRDHAPAARAPPTRRRRDRRSRSDCTGCRHRRPATRGRRTRRPPVSRSSRRAEDRRRATPPRAAGRRGEGVPQLAERDPGDQQQRAGRVDPPEHPVGLEAPGGQQAGEAAAPRATSPRHRPGLGQAQPLDQETGHRDHQQQKPEADESSGSSRWSKRRRRRWRRARSQSRPRMNAAPNRSRTSE